MLQITSNPIGRGRERSCYVHPEDPRQAIKISSAECQQQSRRELRFFQKLKRRRVSDEHVPKFYGLCETNLGQGMVVELIRNYDGEISRPLNWYLAHGYPIEEFEDNLAELYQSFMHNRIVFNHDLTSGNLLFRKTGAARGKLVAIDGLGDVVAIDWLDCIAPLVRRKIHRRWERFIDRLYRSREVQLQREAQAQDSLPAPES